MVTVRVGVVESDPLRRLGLESIVDREFRVEGWRLELVSLTGEHQADAQGLDLVLVDAACVPNPFELIAAFQQREPALRLVVVGLEQAPEYIERVIAAGAKGYLTHDASEQEIRMALKIVLDGSIWAPRKILARLLERGRREQQERLAAPSLTRRERDVLQLLLAGGSNREIGAELAIDEATVKAHLGRLMRKLGVQNRTALSIRATELSLMQEEPT